MWIFIAITGLLQVTYILTACPTELPSECTCTQETQSLYMRCNMTGETIWPKFTSALSSVQFYKVSFRGPSKIPVLTEEALQYINTTDLNLQQLGIEKVHHNAFKASSDRLSTLNMDYNNLLYFPTTAISLLSRSQIYVTMRYNNITSLDHDETWLPDNIHGLNLANNYIRNIDPHFFNETNRIKYLHLSHNYLEDKDVLAILKLRKLYSLNMDNNSLRNISSKDSKRLPVSLQYLYLPKNNIHNIDPNIFHDNNRITYLDLSHNYLEDEDVLAVLKLRRLSYLLMDNNLLRNISSLDSKWLPVSLQYLYLSNNDIHNIDPNIFHDNNTISILDLNHNYLIDGNILATLKLKKLTTLKLGHNLLTTASLDLLQKKLFGNKYNQRFTLLMNNNKLTTTSTQNMFEIKSHRFRLDLSQNKLPDFPNIQIKNCDYYASSEQITIDLSDNNIRHIPRVNSTCNLNRGYNSRSKILIINLDRNKLHGPNAVVINSSNNRYHNDYRYQLEHNEITTLSVESYHSHDINVQRLVSIVIHASHNMLTEVPKVAVKFNGTISNLNIDIDVRNNAITSLDDTDKILKLTPNITNIKVHLYAEDNPLHCDCGMTWIRNSTYTTLRSSTCQTPEELCGYYVGCYPLTDCQSDQSTSYFQQLCSSSPNTTCRAKKKDGSSILRTDTTSRNNNSSMDKSGDDTQLRTMLSISLPIVIGLTLITAIVCCYIYRRRKHRSPTSRRATTTIALLTQQKETYAHLPIEMDVQSA